MGPRPGNTIEVSEDCLFLNIYRPGKIPDEGVATMIWFHGGGFVSASPRVFPGDMLSAYGDVIIVGVNYRPALWGFMSTRDKTLPGLSRPLGPTNGKNGSTDTSRISVGIQITSQSLVYPQVLLVCCIKVYFQETMGYFKELSE